MRCAKAGTPHERRRVPHGKRHVDADNGDDKAAEELAATFLGFP